MTGSYMDLENEAFGDVVYDKDSLCDSLKKYIVNDFEEEEKYAIKREFLLPYRDHNNSKRIYEYITSAKLGKKLSIIL